MGPRLTCLDRRCVLILLAIWLAATFQSGCQRGDDAPEAIAQSPPTQRSIVEAGPPKTNETGNGDADKPIEQDRPEEDEAAGTDLAHPFPHRQPAPSLAAEEQPWLNTAAPLKLEDLRGKFVLLDFWTYCCINCIHILPELKKLEHAYPNELVVIGVHSPKFETEKDLENVREAILRYEIEHPVVNDSEHRIWNRFFVQSWPSLRIVDPEGNLVETYSGEVTFESLKKFLDQAIPYYEEKGTLDRSPLRFDLEATRAGDTPLRFPGKVLADEVGGRLFIADSNHNRIVITDLSGKLLDTVGSGIIGRKDGSFEQCQFDHPQGMALHEETLYVADTGNHLLRKLDLANRAVSTISGTGEQSRDGWPGTHEIRLDDSGNPLDGPGRFVGPPKTTGLNSPWALWVHEQDLYIAMAGPHQIWKMPIDESEIGPYAGNGREDIADGPLLPPVPYQRGASSFAQPSGLASDGISLFVADSEGSAIRAVPFDTEKEVETVIGVRGTLFDFGDVDGSTDVARLQHALGVVYYEGKLYVADTYNSKIKVIDLEKRVLTTLAGAGTTDQEEAPSIFDEPAGITAAAGKLYVADTNNHVIRVVDLKNPNQITTLAIEGLNAPLQD